MVKKKAYSLEKLYADCFTVNEESDPVEIQLKISLEFSDWCKFQAQPFYQEIIRYLDNAKIPEQDTDLDVRKSSQENTEYG